MHPLDITESDRWAEPLYGLVPDRPLKGHARAALRMVQQWFKTIRKGGIVRTRTGDRRVMPYSLRLLARQYVYDRVDPGAFESESALQYAKRYYTYALEVELGNILESWALLDDETLLDEYEDLLVALGLIE